MMGALAAVAGWSLQPALPSTEVAVAWIVGLGVLGQVIPVFLLVHFGPRVGSGLGSLLTATELPVAVGLSALLLGDTLGLTQIGGMVLVLAGIVLPHLPGRRLAVAELRDGR
ncbi:MAG: hypothetical protein EAZ36_05735 [Verrucomicrobia bacterium]|nr:MAG: hypothetical protein EAZ36_05735 [Verrucomicrobiota bacterium]